MEEFIVDFYEKNILTPISIVSEITGISIKELRTLDTYVCIEEDELICCSEFEGE
jgi:hypothetical protein